jgi:hypothetical protein
MMLKFLSTLSASLIFKIAARTWSILSPLVISKNMLGSAKSGKVNYLYLLCALADGHLCYGVRLTKMVKSWLFSFKSEEIKPLPSSF